MDGSPANQFLRQLEILARHRVDFIVIGGVAAVLEGAPISTFDLDIVFDATPENRARLLAALQELNARYKDPAGRHFVPDAEKLEKMRMHLLHTDLGSLDVLARTGAGHGYRDLLDGTIEHELSGFKIRALNLEMVIATKEQANRPKDRIALMYLRQIQAMRDSSRAS